MSYWPRPTTADIGLRAFASSAHRLFTEATIGMQSILLSSKGALELDTHVRHSSQWQIMCHKSGSQIDYGLVLIQWLEEVLYRSEVKEQWLVDAHFTIEDHLEGIRLNANVSWVNADCVEREIEIKAVTSHELQFKEIHANEALTSPWEGVPDFQGPGWFCDVVFDI
ncbi:MAG: hypothetical protein CMA63_05910 [Euryarchaeota archaeon]|nr:hypothetical protein [Euryarchaeota archaeon]